MIGGFRYIRRHGIAAKAARKAIAKASREDAIARLEDAIDKHERRIADAFRESIDQLRDTATIEALTERIEAGDVEGAVAILRPEVTRNALQPLEAAIGAAVLDGGRITAETQPAVRGVAGTQVNFTFNATNPRLSEFAREVSATRIREVSDDVRGVVRDVIQQETVRGTNPLDTARRVRQAVGLTTRQEQAVQNFRRMLETRDPEALARQLRDRRFDPTIRRAIQNDTPLSARQIDRMVERYRTRFIRHRSEVIARTESTRAINGASREFIQSFVDEGLISEQQVRRFWHTARDELVRSSHRQIPALNDAGVGLREAFETPLGPLEFPGDPSGIAANVVNCRCTVFDRVVSAELIEQDAA